MNRRLAGLTLPLLLTSGAHFQVAPVQPPATKQASPSANELPSVHEILSHYARALGGEQALKSLNSRVMKGSFEIPARNISGTAEIYMQAPDHFYSLVSIPGNGRHILAFNGTTGWSSEPQGGLREVTGKELTELRRSSQFLYEWRLLALFDRVRVIEKSMEEDRPVWVVQATPAEGDPELFYFDADTGLLLRHDSTQSTPDGDVPIEHRYSRYISVDGVQVPTLLRHRDPELEWQVSFSEIHHNIKIDTVLFAKPAVAPTGTYFFK